MEDKTEPQKEIMKISFGTQFESVEEAENAKKGLDIYDTELDLGIGHGRWTEHLPKFFRDKAQRLHWQIGIKWEIQMVDGKAHYVFCPCPIFRKGLNAKFQMGWFKVAVDVQKEFKKLLDYFVPFEFIYAEPSNALNDTKTPPN